MRFQAVTGDLTKFSAEVLVNAANSAMIIGGGVDGAFHRAAGQRLINHNAQHYGFGCPTGQVRISPAFDIETAQVIFHTVGPDMREYSQELGDILLAACYNNCMMAAIENGFTSIAFPTISTGVFGFDRKRAAKIAAEFIWSYRDEADMDVTFVCFADEDTVIMNEAIEQRDAEIHAIQWSIGEFSNDEEADLVNDLNTDAPDGVYKVLHCNCYGESTDDGEAVGVTVKDGKFVLEPTLRACAEARNASGYWGNFIEGLKFFPDDDTEAFFEVYIGS